MNYIAVCDTDVGIRKEVNQDSVLIKHGMLLDKEVLLASVCDGMGGLNSGEIASATVVRELSRWFEEDLPYFLPDTDVNEIGTNLGAILENLNSKISIYGEQNGIRMGTTIVAVLFVDDVYIAINVGDSRLYSFGDKLEQMTKDQTFVAREIERGTMTLEEAKVDKRRNLLLQCVGTPESIEPEIISGTAKEGGYLLCSDGFRHVVSDEEIYERLNPSNLDDKDTMRINVRNTIDLIKERKEMDNISAILIKSFR